MDHLDASFFERDPVACARDLVGSHFIWHGCSGRIVETEAYSAVDDPACHTAFRPGARAFVEGHPVGSAYVYLNYGIHWLFNVLVKGGGGQGFVLLRALEPVDGRDLMAARRAGRTAGGLCSGPGKLTRALGIDGSAHGRPFLGTGATGLVAGEPAEIVAGPRIGISRGQELPWRFFEAGNRHVSR